MSRYKLILISFVAVGVFLFIAQQYHVTNASIQQSPELGLLELSPNGEMGGYAMPASGCAATHLATGGYINTCAQTATGYFDAVTPAKCSVAGWAYDPDNSAVSINVDVYKDGPSGQGGTYVTSCVTNVLRGDANTSRGITGLHGFNCLLPASYRATGNHTIYIHAIDIEGGPNNLLVNSPRELNCLSAVVPPTPTPTPVSDPLINITTDKILVRQGGTVEVNWTITTVGYTASCTLLGPGIDDTGISTSGSGTSAKLYNTQQFTISCAGGTTSAGPSYKAVSKSITVDVVPTVQEI